LAEGDGEAGGVGEVRARLRGLLVKALLNRPVLGELLREAVLEYAIYNSPMLSNYVRGVSEFTGLPEEAVRRSRPVREYARRMLGFSPSDLARSKAPSCP
jgi:hypothetical protein